MGVFLFERSTRLSSTLSRCCTLLFISGRVDSTILSTEFGGFDFFRAWCGVVVRVCPLSNGPAHK